MPSGWKHYLIYRGLRGELAGAALELRGNKAHIVISDQDKEQLIYLTGRPFPQELTHINLCGPRDTGYVESPPTFCWTPNGVGNNYYAVEISFTPDFANYYSSFEDLGQFITSTSWTMPYLYYSMLPIGVPVYWRVRGKDLDHSPQTIIASDEVWWFYKEF
jgi:hypothetical protein